MCYHTCTCFFQSYSLPPVAPSAAGQPPDITGAGLMHGGGPLSGLDIGGGFLSPHGGMGPNPTGGPMARPQNHMMPNHPGGGMGGSCESLFVQLSN